MALLAATQVFRSKGFERASLSDLEAAIGTSRAAIYAAFGDKEALFLKALDLCGAQIEEGRLDELREAEDPRAALRAHFDAIAATIHGRQGPGCILTNTSIELTGREPATADRLNKGLSLIEEIFRGRIIRGQEMGQFTQERSAETLARHLANTAQGLRVLSRNPALAPWITDIVETSLSVLAPFSN